jgi:hypothetical protein
VGLPRLVDRALLMISATGFLSVVAVLDSAHVFSPMVLAWSKPELRAIIIRKWGVYIALPIGILVAVFLVPLPQLLGVYWAWNAFHYGMQNFGLLQLRRHGVSADRRVYEGLLCLLIAAIGVCYLPTVFPQNTWGWLIIVVAFDFDHWLCDIALSSRVARWQWAFIAVLMALAVGWLLLRHPLSVYVTSQVVAFRCGLGMVHFLYSARIWKLSDPRIRVLIKGALA